MAAGRPTTPSTSADPAPSAALADARVTFTGRLASMSRQEAHAIVTEAGGEAVSGVSRRTTHLVIGMYGWPLRPDGAVSVKLQQAQTLRNRGGRIEILSEQRFLELVGRRSTRPAVSKSYALDEVARLVGVEPAVIEQWEYAGLIRSEDGRYDFQDIVSLQAVAALVRDGVAPEEIRRSLRALASVIPGTERPLAQLRLVASDAGSLVAQIGDSLVAPDGQQILDFTPLHARKDHAPIVPARTEPTADDWFDRGVWLEEEERFDEAADAYRRTLGHEPARVDALFNLANVLRESGRAEAAEEIYRLTVSVDPTCAPAWYNLADVLECEGCVEDAVGCLERAIALDASFADAHFNLAACLERLGRAADADAHWRQYLTLDGASEWAAVARAHLAGQRGV